MLLFKCLLLRDAQICIFVSQDFERVTFQCISIVPLNGGGECNSFLQRHHYGGPTLFSIAPHGGENGNHGGVTSNP